MEELTCVQFDDPSVFESGCSRAGKNKADVFDPTERGSGMPVLSAAACVLAIGLAGCEVGPDYRPDGTIVDRKSTRLNSSHGYISYAVFCLKKKKKKHKVIVKIKKEVENKLTIVRRNKK